MDVERLREIAEEDNGSDVKFECSSDGAHAAFCGPKQRSVAIPTRRLEARKGDGALLRAPVAKLLRFRQRGIALYTVPRMMPLPVNIWTMKPIGTSLKHGWRTAPAIPKALCQFRVDDKYCVALDVE